MNTDPTQAQKGTPMDMNPSDLEAAMHDALVKVAGPMLEEQTEMRAQMGAQRLLLTLLLADRFADRRDQFNALMNTLMAKTEDALQTLPGGPRSPDALMAQARVQMVLMRYLELVVRNMPSESTRSSSEPRQA